MISPSILRPDRFLPVVVLLFLAATVPSRGDDPAATRATELLAAALEADRGPGVQAAVARDGQVVWSAALGSADLEAGVAMSSLTRLRIGSVSKVLTAALAARLAEAGLLALDEGVGRQLPELPAAYRDLTPTQLAGHVAGVRHYDFSNLEEANNQKRWESVEAALEVFTGDPLVSPPGEAFHYSSFGFNLLGAVAARAAGESYLDALASRVTGPLGLEDTVGDRPWAVVPRRGRFYTVLEDRSVINTVWRDSTDYYPSGGLLSTAGDLARFAWQVFRGDAFSDHSVRRFERPTVLADGSEGPWSFGWQVLRDEAGEVKAFAHGGLTNGATAELRFLPDEGIAVAVVANYNFWFDGNPEVIRVAVEELPALFGTPDGGLGGGSGYDEEKGEPDDGT